MTLTPLDFDDNTYCDLRMDVMTGTEKYPIIGNLVSPEQSEKIIASFKGLLLVGDCDKKAKRAASMMKGRIQIIGGEVRVWSADMKSAYGFDWHPPHECHFWLEVVDKDGNRKLADFSMPGVIIRGLTTCDEIGPYILGREPVILAGEYPKWIVYRRVCIFEEIWN